MNKANEQENKTQIVKPKRNPAKAATTIPKATPVKTAAPKAKIKSVGTTNTVRMREKEKTPPAASREKAAAQSKKKEKALPADIAAQVESATPKKPRKQSKAKQNGKKLVQKGKNVLSPITNTLDGIATDYADRSAVRQTFIALFKLKVPLCILLAVILACSGAFFLFESSKTATTEMSLNYEESAYGLNPNSTRYNVYNIASHEVVSQMLTYCGLNPEDYDLVEISDNISVNPTNKKSFDEETLFITTTYKISFTKPSQIKGVSTKEMLNFLCKAYKDFLYTNYTENRSILSFDIDRFNDEEFLEVADLFDLKAQQLEKYLNTRAKQSKTFTEKESDETFKSLSQKLEDLRNYDIAKYRAFVIEAGCSHDKTRYLRSLAYINRMKQIDYDKDISAYNVHNAGIKMYDESMISNVLIPSIDQSKHTYYMSKTKTGMDYMAQQADEYLKTAQEIAKEIHINREIMGKMQASANRPADIQKASTMIESIRGKFNKLSAQIEAVDKAYIKYKTKDYLTFKSHDGSLLQKMEPIKLAAIAVLFIAGVYALLWLRFRQLGAEGGKQQ